MLGLSSCSTEQQSKASSAETVRDVSVLAVKQANLPDVLEAVGTVRAEQTSDLASPFSLSFGAPVTAQLSLKTTHCGTAGTTWRISGQP